MKEYLSVLKNYAGFSGRARRQEYWMFILFHIIFTIVLLSPMFIAMAAGLDEDLAGVFLIPLMLYILATFIPYFAVIVRRLHDTNKSGWMILIRFIPFGGIVLFVFTVMEGDRGKNKYGNDPKESAVNLEEFGETELLEN